MPYGRYLQREHRRLLQSRRRERDLLQRWQRVHPDGLLSERNLHRLEPGDVHRDRSVPYGRDVQHEHRRVLEPRRDEWDGVQ